MKIKEFLRPSSLEEAVQMMRHSAGRGAYLAGGTDLLLSERDIDSVIDLAGLGLNHIKADEQEIHIGATTTISELARSKNVPEILREAALNFASMQIRNVATVGGNLASAVPSADMAPPLLALEAQARILGEHDHERVIPLKDFFVGPRQTVLKDDLLVELIIPQPNKPSKVPSPKVKEKPSDLRLSTFKGKYIKLAHRPNDIAIVNIAIAILLEEANGGGSPGLPAHFNINKVRIALGAVAPTPMRAVQAEAFLQGKALTEEDIRQAAELVTQEVRPITDHRASADYRRKMSALLTRRILRAASPFQ